MQLQLNNNVHNNKGRRGTTALHQNGCYLCMRLLLSIDDSDCDVEAGSKCLLFLCTLDTHIVFQLAKKAEF